FRSGGPPRAHRRRRRPLARPPWRGGAGGAGKPQRPAPDLLRQALALEGPRPLPRRRLPPGGAGLTGPRAGQGGNGRLAAVTGATGFLGRQVVRALSAQGWRIRILARRDPIDPLWKDVVPEVAPGDVADDAALARLCAGADVLIHGAGLVKARSRAHFD